MATTYEDIDVNQGADIAIELDCVDEAGAVKDLTNHSINAKLKRTYKSTDAEDIQTFNAIVQSPPDCWEAHSFLNKFTNCGSEKRPMGL